MQILSFVILLDMLPSPPFKFGTGGAVGAIAFGLLLAAAALVIFSLIRKKSSKTVLAGILIAFAGGSIIIWAVTAIYDYKAERDYQEEIINIRKSNNNAREKYQEDIRKRENTNSDQQPNTNLSNTATR